MAISAAIAMSGSPPRTWGIREALQGGHLLDRFTPTHVGNTLGRPLFSSRRTVHPHARGEYRVTADRPLRLTGSPPRTWGIHLPTGSKARPPRFTPTHVGNTRRPASARGATPVHPHARGEYGTNTVSSTADAGSPPRTWGILAQRMSGRGLLGFTPTHVGNTGPGPGRRRSRPVHPHARGEYAWLKKGDLPHARFTPTHVGNTSPGFWRRRWLRGSPPRTWGIRFQPTQHARPARFTPTHVGNTEPLRTMIRWQSGSPPRTWGIRRDR